MKSYMESWNQVIEYVEGIVADIFDVLSCSYMSDDTKEAEIKYMLAIYSIMLMNNFSRKS